MSTRPDDPPGSAAAWSHAGLETDAFPARGPDRYARGGELGRGGMGIVEAAVDTWLDRDVAVKRPRPDRIEEHLTRLTREARITARLVHPAIPPIYDVGEDEQGAYYTMPVLVGATLGDRAGSASLRSLVGAVATASRAAGCAHARGVVHRDLKPDNILLGDHGEVWVLDWGVALDPSHPDSGNVGTPGFQAPEQHGGAVVTAAADVYSLGVTLRSVLDRRAEAHPELRAVAERATRAEPKARYADGDALAEELERWLDGRLVQAHAYPARELLWHLAGRWRAPLAVAAVAVAAGTVLGVGALRAQQAERERADRNLSVSLAQQAAALRLRDARPEAEVLAAHSLALGENPLARGVWMAWAASPSYVLREEADPPCAQPFAQPDGYVICAGVDLRVLDPDGRERWSAPLDLPPASGGSWIGEVVEARRYEGDLVVLRRSSNQIEVWRDGARVHTIDAFRGHLGLADGPTPAFYAQRRIGLVDAATGTIAWGQPTCEQVETALVREDAVVIGCREPRVFVGSFDAPGPAIPVEGSPSAIAWLDGPVIGTFEGTLLSRDGADWVTTAGAAGGVRQIVPLADGLVAVVGERGQVHAWSRRDRVWLGALPSGGSAAAAVAGDLRIYGASLRNYEAPEGLRPVAFDRSAEGGIAAFDVSPSGGTVAAGSATGEVVTFDTSTGAARREVPPGGGTAKSVRFRGDGAFVYARPEEGLQSREIEAASSTPLDLAAVRAARAWDGGLALLPWSPAVVLLGADARTIPLPTRPLAVADAGTLWAADERGGVHELVEGAFVRRFDLPVPSGSMAASGELLLFADGLSIEARDHDGAARWRWTGTAAVTALDADGSWIAAGDVEGRVLLLRPDGTLVAGITGHTRRVSDVILRGDRLYTGSWDGFVRVWGLADAEADPQALVERATRTWGLTLDEALAGADPLGPGG